MVDTERTTLMDLDIMLAPKSMTILKFKSIKTLKFSTSGKAIIFPHWSNDEDKTFLNHSTDIIQSDYFRIWNDINISYSMYIKEL